MIYEYIVLLEYHNKILALWVFKNVFAVLNPLASSFVFIFEYPYDLLMWPY